MRKREKAALFLLIMILTGLIAFLAGITVYSSDDYWYSTFMNGGIAEYFRMMKEHYLTCNGRNLVHFFAQLILHFGNGLFAVFAVGIFLLIPLSADRIRGIGCSGDTGDVVYGGKEKYGSANGKKTKDTNGRPELFMILIFFAAGILLLPLPVMVNGVLWISGFCNYALPAGMAAAEILILKGFAAQRTRRFFLSDLAVCLFTFLCGATTEQGGSVSVLICFFFLIQCFALNRRRVPACLAAALFGILGLATVFLSPATRSRAAAEAPGQTESMLQHIIGQAGEQAGFFSGYVSVLLMSVLFFAATSAFFFKKGRGAGAAATVLFLISAGFLAGLRFCDGMIRTASYAGLMFCFLAAAVFYIFTEYREISLLLLNALASLAVMLFTSSSGHRVYLPFCLWLLTALAWILSSLSGRWRPQVRIAAALIFTVVVCWQMWTQIPQYFHNYEVDRMNQESARQARNTGEMDYCIDYNPDYTHVKAYNDAYFYQSYLKSEELPPDTRINFYSEKLPSVWVAGEKASFPAVRGERYGYLLPLRDIVELLGGTIEVESGWNLQMEITLDGRVYQCTGDRGSSVITVSGISGDGSPFQVKGEISQGYYCTCLSENIYTDAFGLKLERSDDGMKIMLAFS